MQAGVPDAERSTCSDIKLCCRSAQQVLLAGCNKALNCVKVYCQGHHTSTEPHK